MNDSTQTHLIKCNLGQPTISYTLMDEAVCTVYIHEGIWGSFRHICIHKLWIEMKSVTIFSKNDYQSLYKANIPIFSSKIYFLMIGLSLVYTSSNKKDVITSWAEQSHTQTFL